MPASRKVRKRPGRPPKPHGERMCTIRLPNRSIEILDGFIRSETRNRGDDPREIDYSSQRRVVLSRLIETRLDIEALLPTRVDIDVCPGPYSENDLRQITAWIAEQSPLLTASAPACVQEQLQINRLQRKRLERTTE